MAIRLKHISGTLGILALMAIATPAALAQETPETIPTAFDRLMSTYSGDFFSNRTPSANPPAYLALVSLSEN